jgi:hypothetical protein
MLSPPVACKRFQAVCGRRAQIVEVARLMKHVELAQRCFLNAAESFHEFAHPQALGGAVAKRPDHTIGIYIVACNTSSV